VSARQAAVLLAVATMLASCGGDDDGDATATEEARDCPTRLVWDDDGYLGNDVRLPAERGEELGQATIPACGPNEERQVRVGRIPGVDPSVAVASSQDAFTVWVAESAQPQEYPDALKRVLYGLSCEENRPFTLTGRLLRLSERGQPLSVQLDVDRTGGSSAYSGVVIDLGVRDTTDGLNSRGALSERRLGTVRLRARVRCVEADRPDRTFLAESLEAASGR
jgi:hypothetical protein